MTLLERFQANHDMVIDALKQQRLVGFDNNVANEIATAGILQEFLEGDTIISQDDGQTDVYCLLTGEVRVLINGKELPHMRYANDSVGEMSAIEPTAPRSATLIANNNVIAVKLDARSFNNLMKEYPHVCIAVTKDLSRRLTERNALIDKSNENPKLFIISTVEAIEIARDIQLGLEHEQIDVRIWNDPIHFIPGQYTLESLEQIIKDYDFGLAIMSGDDFIVSRDKEQSAVRDNVIFELGLFMGSLGRSRTLLAIPKNEDIKLASDLEGLTPLKYKANQVNMLVTRLSRIIKDLGVK